MSSYGSSARYRLVEDAFQRAVDLPEDRRAEFLARECGTDHSLRDEVEELLRSYDAAGDIFDRPLYDRLPANDASDPVRIGRYRIQRKLGQGGMAVVFEATQDQPHRSVAIKIIRPGAFSPKSRSRFEFEAAVLARLQHPGIAHIYEAGLAEVIYPTGGAVQQPFFAMEMVQGETLQHHMKRMELGTTQRPASRFRVQDAAMAQRSVGPYSRNTESRGDRLDLFIKICDAVEHAHQKGVIHRDLKPSNIIVTPTGDPKVLDFGVARVTESDVQLTTMHSEAALVGTLPYMSPEQVSARLDQLDTRSDVYALGVILYELLAGCLPYDLAGKPIAAAARVITEVAPTPLSAVDRAFRGDLDTIVSKALEKDPARRYGSVHELAADVRRYLNHEPIAARPPSAVYQVRKFAQRNRGLVAGVAAAFLTLVLGVTGTTVGLVRAEQRRSQLELAHHREARQREYAEEQRTLAEQRAEQTSRVAEFQSGMLSDIDIEAMGRGLKEQLREQVRVGLVREQAERQPGGDGSMQELEAALAAFDHALSTVNEADVARNVMDEFVLRRAAERLPEQFEDQPLVQAQIQEAIGITYRTLGLYDAAERRLRDALDLRRSVLGDDPLVAGSLNDLAVVIQAQGDYAAAERLCRDGLAMRRNLLGHDHPDVAESLNELALLLKDAGDFAGAEPLFREALGLRRNLLGDEHPDVAESLNNLAALLSDQGDYAAAEPLYRDALAMRRKLLGDEHPDVTTSLNNLAAILYRKGDYAAAEPLFREALALRRRLLGEEHPYVAISLNNLAAVLRALGDDAAAEPVYREALALRRKLLGDAHPYVAHSLNNLAALLHRKGDYAAAEPLFREALELRRELLGYDHPDVAQSLNNLAMLLKDQGDYTAAEPLYREALALRRELLGDEHPEVAVTLNNLAALLRYLGDHAAAEPLYREALAIQRSRLPGDSLKYAETAQRLAVSLNALEQFAEAEELLHEAHGILVEAFDASHERTRTCVDALIDLYDAWHLAKPDDGYDTHAAAWRAQRM